jgi:hypothetical protein
MLLQIVSSSGPLLSTPSFAILFASPFAELRTQHNSIVIPVHKCSWIFYSRWANHQCLWIFPILVPFWSFLTMLITSAKSPSTMAFIIPSQLRISRPVSRAPNSATLLVEFPRLPTYSRMMFPLLSLITPPKLVLPGFPFTTPSKFNLRELEGGGFQLRSPTWSCGDRLH